MGKLLFEQTSYHKKIDYELTKPEQGAVADPLRIAKDFLTWLDVLIIEVGAPTY